MSAGEDDETRTFRGRSLDELVPQIRSELGDDAVIVASRETTSGGVGGFFAKRELEVEARPAEPEPVSDAARIFAERLREAAGQMEAAPAREPDAMPPAGPPTGFDELFAANPPQGGGLASLFNVGRDAEDAAPAQDATRAAPAPEAPPAPDAPPAAQASPTPDAPAVEGPPSIDASAIEEDDAWAEGPTPVLPPSPAPVVAEPPAPVAPLALVAPPRPAPVAAAAPAVAAAPAALPVAAQAAADGLVARGVRVELAQELAEQAVTSLLPLDGGADPAALVREALARRIPTAPLRRGGGVVAFVGPGGAGKTRCVARLAAAHARHGVRQVAVLALSAPDGGAELTRLLAPYGVPLHVVVSGAEGAGRIAPLRDEGLVLVDTPGVSPRNQEELRVLQAELAALAPDELHLAIPATIAPASARELVTGLGVLGVDAIALTHGDETDQLGTVVGLAVESGLPLSYLSRGQAVDAGLRPATAAELAATLVP